MKEEYNKCMPFIYNHYYAIKTGRIFQKIQLCPTKDKIKSNVEKEYTKLNGILKIVI